MRYLILSDIHANQEALLAVLEAAEGRYDYLLCCGDLVGYGADPSAVIEWTRTNVKSVVRGNHDKACAGLEDLEWFNPSARASAVWTQRVLADSEIEYLARLPKGPALLNGCAIIHGSPVDEDEYLLQVHDVSAVVPYLERTVTFYGHTHVQGGFLIHRNGVRLIPPVPLEETSMAVELDPDCYYLINPGSVGQPRDGDARAGFAVYYSDLNYVEYFRVAYDVKAAQDKIREAGLPKSLADRLAKGT